MKKLALTALLFALFAIACNKVPQKASVVFSDKTYDGVLAEAATTGKKVFLDFYADW